TTTAFRRVPSDDDEPMIPVLPRRRAKVEPNSEPAAAPPRPRAKATKDPADEQDGPTEDDDVPEFPVLPRRGATVPPEPADDEQITASRGPRIRGRKGPATPELDGALRYPDLFGADADVRLDLPTPEPAAAPRA